MCAGEGLLVNPMFAVQVPCRGAGALQLQQGAAEFTFIKPQQQTKCHLLYY